MGALAEEGKEYSNVEAVDIIHQVANLYITTKNPRDYGTGEEYTSVEVHMLKHIADNPGITVTELAKFDAKTKGAISQILKKIEGKGLIFREPAPGNDNRCYLYLTRKGEELDQAQRSYDQKSIGESMDQVRQLFTGEEVNTAFRVLEKWLEIRREVQLRRDEQRRMMQKEKKAKKGRRPEREG